MVRGASARTAPFHTARSMMPPPSSCTPSSERACRATGPATVSLPTRSARSLPAASAAARHPEAEWVFIYTCEAHPGEHVRYHDTFDRKVSNARLLRDEAGIRRPILVDDLSGTVHRRYGAMPNMTWVIDRGGRVAYKANWTSAANVEAFLARSWALAGSVHPAPSWRCTRPSRPSTATQTARSSPRTWRATAPARPASSTGPGSCGHAAPRTETPGGSRRVSFVRGDRASCGGKAAIAV